MSMDIPGKEFEPGGIFHDRGISPEVAEGRFIWYDHDACDGHPFSGEDSFRSWPCVQATFDQGERPYFDLPVTVQRNIARKMMQVPGILMIRNRVRDDLPLVLPEMRPEREILTSKPPTFHQHSNAKVAGSEGWQRHVNKDRKLGPAAVSRNLVELLKARYPKDWSKKLVSENGTVILWRHAGENSPEWHGHRRTARYLFSMQMRKMDVWTHTHEADFTVHAYGSEWGRDQAERKHLLSPDHADVKRVRAKGEFVGGTFYKVRPPRDQPNLKGPALEKYWRSAKHEHTSSSKDSTNPLADRLSISPVARERLEGGVDEVWIAMESCLKEAAIMTAILREDRRATVVSYPSVTLYPRELDDWAAEWLEGKRVYIVPDNDAHENQMVRMQAFIARERIRAAVGDRAGKLVHIAAPPLLYNGDGSPQRDDEGKLVKLGADDALGPLHGYALDDFVIWERPEPLGFTKLKWERLSRARRGRDGDGDLRQAAVFKWLALLADDNGETQVSDRVLARLGFPEEWGEAEAADLALGHDPQTNRPHDQHRDTLRSRAGYCVDKMREIGIVTVTGKDVVIGEDGNELQKNGLSVTLKKRRIDPNAWTQFVGEKRPVGTANSPLQRLRDGACPRL